MIRRVKSFTSHQGGGNDREVNRQNNKFDKGYKDLLEKGMATHSSIPDWRIPWTEEPGGLQSMGSQRVKHD